MIGFLISVVVSAVVLFLEFTIALILIKLVMVPVNCVIVVIMMEDTVVVFVCIHPAVLS